MASRFVLFAFFFSLGLIFSCGCAMKRSVLPYAHRDYLKQQALRRSENIEPRLDEAKAEDVLLDMDVNSSERKEWERQAYESIDEWALRIKSLLEVNQDAIRFSKGELEGLQETEKKTVEEIKRVIYVNEDLKKQISKPMEKSSREEVIEEAIIPADFDIFVVREGDTLFSISMEHYESAEMIKEISMWNQGWVRHPDEIIAGLGLVLFPKKAQEKHTRVVEEYIHRLRPSK